MHVAGDEVGFPAAADGAEQYLGGGNGRSVAVGRGEGGKLLELGA